VVTTDATTGATAALLLPGTQSQNITHEDLRACALAALRMVWASAAWMAVEMLATWFVRKLRGDARPSPYVCPSELTISFAYVPDAN
jgi:hypothetical protein